MASFLVMDGWMDELFGTGNIYSTYYDISSFKGNTHYVHCTNIITTNRVYPTNSLNVSKDFTAATR